jgi:hypothetical protein
MDAREVAKELKREVGMLGRRVTKLLFIGSSAYGQKQESEERLGYSSSRHGSKNGPRLIVWGEQSCSLIEFDGSP